MGFDLDAFGSADMDTFSNNFTAVNGVIKPEESPDAELPLSPPETPTKPKKRKSTSSDGKAKPAPAKKKQATTSNGRGKGRPIGDTPEDLDEADRILYDLRKENKPWREVIDAIESATGEKIAVKENDYDTLRESVLDVDVSIEKQCQELKAKRWAQVAELMEKKGTELYPVPAVEKCFKRIGATSVSAAAEE